MAFQVVCIISADVDPPKVFGGLVRRNVDVHAMDGNTLFCIGAQDIFLQADSPLLLTQWLLDQIDEFDMTLQRSLPLRLYMTFPGTSRKS
jgi:hypothetical protein